MRTEEGNKKAMEARKAWNKENMKTVGANMRKEDVDKFRRIAEERGTTPSAMIKEYVLAVIAGHEDFRVEEDTHTRIGPTTIVLTPKTMDRLKNKTSRYQMNPYKLADKVLSAWMDMDDSLRGKKGPGNP